MIITAHQAQTASAYWVVEHDPSGDFGKDPIKGLEYTLINGYFEPGTIVVNNHTGWRYFVVGKMFSPQSLEEIREM